MIILLLYDAPIFIYHARAGILLFYELVVLFPKLSKLFLIQGLGNDSIGQTIRSQQPNTCTQRSSLWNGFGPYPGFQRRSLLFRHR